MLYSLFFNITRFGESNEQNQTKIKLDFQQNVGLYLVTTNFGYNRVPFPSTISLPNSLQVGNAAAERFLIGRKMSAALQPRTIPSRRLPKPKFHPSRVRAENKSAFVGWGGPVNKKRLLYLADAYNLFYFMFLQFLHITIIRWKT